MLCSDEYDIRQIKSCMRRYQEKRIKLGKNNIKSNITKHANVKQKKKNVSIQ